MRTRMRSRIIGTLIFIGTLTGGGVAWSQEPTQDSIPAAIADVCKNHGGANCSVLTDEAVITCNDGTIDDTTIIYAVPQCHDEIEATVQNQSQFLVDSGCIPPGELACTTYESYAGLREILTEQGTTTSELGKRELAQCLQDIQEYAAKQKAYQSCLARNDNPTFSLPTNEIVQPILKALFCPLVYGTYAEYHPDYDVCACADGYFLSGGTCVEASTVCKTLHGAQSSAQNGTCVGTLGSPVPTPRVSSGPGIGMSGSQTQTPSPSSQRTPLPLDPFIPLDSPDGDAPSPTESQPTRLQTFISLVISNIRKLFSW